MLAFLGDSVTFDGWDNSSSGYKLKKPEKIRTTFYNQIGKQVDIIKGNQTQGLNKTIWTPKNIPNGIYYFKFQADELVVTGKMVLMR